MLNTNIMNKESNRIRNRGGKEDITDIIVCWCSVGFSSSRRTTAATTHSIQNDLTYAAESVGKRYIASSSWRKQIHSLI